MFVLGDGTRVAAGSLVRVGYFETANDPSSTFVEFGTTTLSSVGDQSGGHILASGQSIANAATTFANRQLYIWVYNAGTAAGASQSEIFTSTEWTTPGNFNTSDAVFTIRLGTPAGVGTPPVVANLQAPGDAAPGSYTVGDVLVSGTANPNGSIYNLGVPEPSTALMSALVGLGLLVRRRR